MRTLLFNALVSRLFQAEVNAVFDQGFNYGVQVSGYRLTGGDMRMSGCKAIQMSDQMVCNKCGVRWDVNDPEPPTCGVEQPPVQAEAPAPKQGNRAYLAFKNNISLIKQQLGEKK